jgi:GT2 family glycosyltransferase
MDLPASTIESTHLSEIFERLGIGDEFLWVPERLVPFEHWVGHIPFAFWLLKALRPRHIVELGTHRGNSYSALCQGVAALRLDAQIHAVDTWEGDLHMPREEGLLKELRAHHDPRYGSFSTLMQMTFDEARSCFGDGGIDLLHIDGTHTYEAVRHDFENWRSALSPHGVVLFHDTVVRRANYGVWRLWQELSEEYPSFEFHHSYGLGVLGVGPEQKPLLRTLYALSEEESAAARIRALFATRGDAHVSRLSYSQAVETEGRLTSQVQQLQEHQAMLLQRLEASETAQGQSNALAEEREAVALQLRQMVDQLTQEREAAATELRQTVDQLAQERAAAIQLRQTVDQLAKEREAAAIRLRQTVDQQAQERDAAAMQVRQTVDRLMQERDTIAAHAADEIARAHTAAESLSIRLAEVVADRTSLIQANILIETSTTWRATKPLRTFLSRHKRVARAGRRSMKLGWWIISGQLSTRLRHRRLSQKVKRQPADNLIDSLLHHSPPAAQEGRDRGPDFSTPAYIPAHPETQQVAVNQAAETPVITQAMPADADGHWEWRAYNKIKQEIASAEANHREGLQLKPFPILTIAPEAFGCAARGLTVPRFPEPLVSIIVPVFNNIKETLECLASLTQNSSDSVPYEVIIADDGSTDATEELLCTIENLYYIRNAENQGFLRNCNGAAKSARGDYLLFLNNDVQVTGGWLAPLVAAFSKYPNIGAVGPKIVYPDGRLQEAGVLINRDCTARLIGHGDDPSLPRYGFSREVDYCSGACLIVGRDQFEAMGGFDDSLAPAYCEDMDLCLRLRQQGLATLYVPDSVIVHHLSRTSEALGIDYKMNCITTNLQKMAERWQPQVDAMNRTRLIAFYLPQFHPIPENDRWWKMGFTEWTNVTKAIPNFVGHYQPRVPADLGYYDLRVLKVMEQQAELAQRYGIEGFCYYYYWFAGKRLLELPIERMLETGRPDFPFCLCWANENWTRRWDGQDADVLMEQQHSDQDDLAVIRDLSRFLRQKNYIHINGKPLLLIYRIDLFPNFARTAEIWRDFCREDGIGEIYITAAETFQRSVESIDPAEDGCDAATQFPPHGHFESQHPPGPLLNPNFRGRLYNYEECLKDYVSRPLPSYKRFPGVMPAWDNSPRQQDSGSIFEGSTPGAFQAWVEEAIDQTREQHTGAERIVFINGWNEWAEGAYLEPDKRFGHTYLEAARNAQSHWRGHSNG